MVARPCAKRAHQLAATLLQSGVGPSRLPTAPSCRCHLPNRNPLSGAAGPLPNTPALLSAPARAVRRFATSATASDALDEPTASTKPRSLGLLTEEVSDAEPTLEYLDSLRPHVRRPRKEQRPSRGAVSPFAKGSSGDNAEDKLWERTKARINASFTRDQLAALARGAKLPGSYSTKVRKDDLVRRIMIHRFGMLDAKERAERERREELQRRSVRIPFRPAELYLLLAGGSDKVRQEAGKARVIILPQGVEQRSASDELGFWIRGNDDGIARMTKWIEDFKQSIQTKEEELVLVPQPELEDGSSASAAQAFPPELVRFISQLSACFTEVRPLEDGKAKLSLTYLQEQAAQKAVLLLRQYQAATVEATQRIGAAAHGIKAPPTQEYAMLPFAPNEPTSWIKQADDALYGTASDLSFRIAHVPELNALTIFLATKFHEMKLAGWTSEGSVDFDEPFQALYETATRAASETVADAREVEYSATLGHLLFSTDALTLADEQVTEDELLAKLQDPLTPPRAGSSPLASMLDWVREFRVRFGKEASRFVPATLFRSQKNISFDIWLEKQGYTVASRASAEKVVLVYRPAAAGYVAPLSKLEVTLARQTESAHEGEEAAWLMQEARWVSSAESDVLVPERSADLRLGAKLRAPVDAEARASVEMALAGYIDARAVYTADVEEAFEASEESEEASDRPASASPSSPAKALPPSTLHMPGGDTWTLESAIRRTVQQYEHRGSLSQPARPTGTLETSASPAAQESDGIASAEEAASAPEANAEAVDESRSSHAISRVLLREISQDLATATTAESLRLVWRLDSTTPPPAWEVVLPSISEILDRHEMSIR